MSPSVEAALRFQVGQINQIMAGQKVSGDGVLVVESEHAGLFGVVDGLGHGEAAARSAKLALSMFEAEPERPLAELLERIHRALRSERGAVAGLLRIQRSGPFEAAIVGNICVVHLRQEAGSAPKRAHILGQPGVLGSTLRRITPQRGEACEGDLFVLHSDGVQSRADLGPLAGLDAQECAERVVDEYGKTTDDASCLVIRIEGGLVRPIVPPPRARMPSLSEAPTRTRVLRLLLLKTSDAPVAANSLLQLARKLGGAERRAWELSIVASELASNATRHAAGGQLDVFFDAEKGEIILDVRDVGGKSSGSGLGVGLQAVERLADSVEVERTPQGARVVVKKRIVFV